MPHISLGRFVKPPRDESSGELELENIAYEQALKEIEAYDLDYVFRVEEVALVKVDLDQQTVETRANIPLGQ